VEQRKVAGAMIFVMKYTVSFQRRAQIVRGRYPSARAFFDCNVHSYAAHLPRRFMILFQKTQEHQQGLVGLSSNDSGDHSMDPAINPFDQSSRMWKILGVDV